jgi:uncharacterized membrane protein HdeD (DUF308 family)
MIEAAACARLLHSQKEDRMTNIHSARPPFAGALMIHALAKNWWLILLRGICAVIFGLLTFAWPGVTLAVLVLFYGAFAFADGVLALIAAIMGGQPAPRWWLAIVGVLGIAVGLITLMMPGITALFLLYCIAFWAITIGVMQIFGAIRLRKEIDNEWMLIASGIISVLFGLILVVSPGAGALGVLFVIGVYAVIHGIILITLAMRLRRHA